MQTTHPRRWTALAVIALAQFMVIMDTSIIGVALPKIQADVGFTPESLSWVFNAYVVAFGGLPLLGGRLSDLVGAKRVFSACWLVLAGGSLAAGLADTTGVEIAARAVRGCGVDRAERVRDRARAGGGLGIDGDARRDRRRRGAARAVHRAAGVAP